jgi:hypothetical protein
VLKIVAVYPQHFSRKSFHRNLLMRPIPQPKDHVFCPKCGVRYGFIKCRVTLSDGRNICLGCGTEEERVSRDILKKGTLNTK